MTSDTDAINLVYTLVAMHDAHQPNRVLVAVIQRAFAVERQRGAEELASVIERHLPAIAGWADTDLTEAAEALQSALDKYQSAIRGAER